jgi:hypothetical protein
MGKRPVEWVIVNDELGGMWKEAIYTILKHSPNNCLEGLRETTKISLLRIQVHSCILTITPLYRGFLSVSRFVLKITNNKYGGFAKLYAW